MSRIRLILTLMLIFYLTLLLPLGCGLDSKTDLYWFRDPNGFFHTNDLKRAQEEIPFTIVLPSYLPDDMDLNTLKIYGPIETNYDDRVIAIEVHISYISGERVINIDEDNTGAIMYPSSDEPIFLDINGITVLRQTSNFMERVGYYWTHNTIRYAVRAYQIDKDEAEKIVKSMIKQIK